MRLVVAVAVLALAVGIAAPAQAQHRVGVVGGGGGGWHGWGGGWGGWSGGWGGGGSHGWGGWGYAAALPQHPVYVNAFFDGTHDWRFWSPTTKVIVAPVPAQCVLGDAHHSSDGLIRHNPPGPHPAPPTAPLGDIARLYRRPS